MKKNYTHIVALLDRSGSMTKIIAEMREGFNEFMHKQKELDGECTATVVLFDNEYHKLFDFINLTELPLLTSRNYNARGSTALIDAMSRLIDETGVKLARMNEEDRPEKVIFLTITDGEENDSKQFTNEDLKERTERQQNVYNWQFVYIGANQDSFFNAAKFGLTKTSGTVNFNTTTAGVHCFFNATSDAAVRYRASTSKDAAFSYTVEEQSLCANTK